MSDTSWLSDVVPEASGTRSNDLEVVCGVGRGEGGRVEGREGGERGDFLEVP